MFWISVANSKVSTHGHMLPEGFFIGQSAKEIRLQAGEPAFIDNQNWYYIQIEISQNNLGLKKRYTAITKKIIFDKNMKVMKIQEYSIKGAKPSKAMQASELKEEKLNIAKKLTQIFSGVAPKI